MKVLVLSTCYPRRDAPHHGAFIHRQIAALAGLGVDCRVLQPAESAPPFPLRLAHADWRAVSATRRHLLPAVEGIPVDHPGWVRWRPSRLFRGDWWEQCGHAVARHVRARPDLRDADAVYAQFLCHEGFAAVVARESLGIPVAAIARGDDVHLWPERWPDRIPKLRRVLAEADALLACSDGLARDVAAWAAPGTRVDVEVVRNGIDTATFRPAAAGERAAARERLGLPAEGRLLLCVAAPSESKGWPEFLDSLASLGPAVRGWRLAALAPVRTRVALDLPAEAARRGLAAILLPVGALAPEAMPHLYRACDAFVLPSRNEGLSNAVVEALASGLPVVATDVGGHGDVIRDGEDGLLVPPRDTAALAAALERVLGDPAERARLAARAPDAARRVGTVEENAARLRGILERVAAGAGRGA